MLKNCKLCLNCIDNNTSNVNKPFTPASNIY